MRKIVGKGYFQGCQKAEPCRDYGGIDFFHEKHFFNSKQVPTFAGSFQRGMKKIPGYDLSVARLADKIHRYEWEGDRRFFAQFPESPVHEGSFKAEVVLEKSATMLQLQFAITGTLVLACDRSLDEFDFSFETQHHLILKFGDRDEELTDEIEIISRDTQEINMGHYLYDYIILAIPMKKLHPRYREAAGEEGEESLLIYSSEIKTEPENEDAQTSDTKTDPRWEALKKLK